MTDLFELAQIMDGYKLRQIEVLTRPLRPGIQESRYRLMYHALANGDVHTEEEAAQLLGLDLKGRPFRRFLLEFRRRLYAPLLFLDTESSEQFNATQKANFECLRKLGIFQTLLHRKCFINAAILAEEIVEIAAQNDVTLVALEMATYLKRYFVEQEPNPDKYRYYKAYVDRFRFDWEAENKAMEYYQAISVQSMKNKSIQVKVAESAKMFDSLLEQYALKCNTIIFLAGYFALKFMAKMTVYRWIDCIKICDIAIEKFEEKTCSSPRVQGIFYGHKIVCLYMLERYDESLKLNSENIKRDIVGSRGWFIGLELHTMIALKAGDYPLAVSTIKEVYTSPYFKFMPNLMHETWKILAAYVVLVNRMGKPNSNNDDLETIIDFKLRKFLNDVPIFSKDKKGLNIPILLIQFLFLMYQKEFDLAQEKLEALRKYRVKHFRITDGYYRTQLFIRAICTLGGSAFNKAKFIKKSKPFIENMMSVPKGFPDQHYKIEVIPYETLWKWIIQLLDI
jgi:hypothetical protein